MHRLQFSVPLASATVLAAAFIPASMVAQLHATLAPRGAYDSRLSSPRARSLERPARIIGASSTGPIGPVKERVPRARLVDSLLPESLLAARTLRYGGWVSVSPDGRYVAYVVSPSSAQERQGDVVTTRTGWRLLPSGAPSTAGQIWVLNLRTRRAVAIAGEHGHSWAPAWSPTGSVLAFLADRDGRVRLWCWRPGAHAALRRVSEAPLSSGYYGALRWTPDGKNLILASPSRADLDEAAARERAKAPGQASKTPSVEVRRSGFSDSTDQRVSSSLGVSVLRAALSEIVQVDVRTGRVRHLAQDVGIDWLQPSPDGQLLAYAALRDYSRPEGLKYQSYYTLLVVPLSGGAPRILATDLPMSLEGQDRLRWAPNSRAIAFSTLGLAAQHGLFRIAVDGSGSVPLQPYTPFMDVNNGAAEGVVWDAEGRALYGWSGPVVWRYDAVSGRGREIARLPGKHIWHLVTRGDFHGLYQPTQASILAVARDDSGTTAGFYRINVVSGEVTPLYEVNGRLGGERDYWTENTTVVSARDSIVFVQESAIEPSELWEADASFHQVRRVSHLSGTVSDGPLGERRLFQWTTANGERRRGILLLPTAYKPGTRYPLIVWMYERSIPQFVNTFGLTGHKVFNLHLFATRGYAAFYPDLTWAPESVMTSLGEHVHSGVEALARLGIVDSTRVGMVGHSSGGYDVLAVAVTCPWVRAGVAAAGPADMVMAFGGTMDNPIGYDWAERQMGLGAPPWVHPERYVANSPSYHFDQVKAPLLLLQGTADAFNLGHMDLAYAELKRLGKPVEYRRYPGEGHVPDLWTPANRLDASRRMLEWFDTYVKAAR